MLGRSFPGTSHSRTTQVLFTTRPSSSSSSSASHTNTKYSTLPSHQNRSTHSSLGTSFSIAPVTQKKMQIIMCFDRVSSFMLAYPSIHQTTTTISLKIRKSLMSFTECGLRSNTTKGKHSQTSIGNFTSLPTLDFIIGSILEEL
mmetsp:Transcript_41461/g.61357  ORF Transcript_41461/g.61357 Transcript_41461/m.61357 type:complete len:144 (+) Transcript_41461:92-523(+)